MALDENGPTVELHDKIVRLGGGQVIEAEVRVGQTTEGRDGEVAAQIGAEHHHNGAMFHRTLAVLPALVGAWRDRAVFHRLRCTGAPDEAPPERDPAST